MANLKKQKKFRERLRVGNVIGKAKILIQELLDELKAWVALYGEDDDSTIKKFNMLEGRWKQFCKANKITEMNLFADVALKFLKYEAGETKGSGEVDGEQIDKEDQPTEGSGPEAPVADNQTGTI